MAAPSLPVYKLIRSFLPFGFLFFGWEVIGWLGDSTVVPPFSVVTVNLVESLLWGDALLHVQSTLWKMLVSFVVGGLAGITLGVALPLFPLLDAYFQPLIYSTYALPRVALIPLFILWLGLGDRTVIAAASFAVFYVVLVNTRSGVRQAVDPILLRAARNLGANRFQLITKVYLPASTAPIFAGLRLAVGQSLISVVSGEILIGDTGLGFWIWEARYNMETALVFVNLVWLGLLGFLLTRVTEVMESRRGYRENDTVLELWAASEGEGLGAKGTGRA